MPDIVCHTYGVAHDGQHLGCRDAAVAAAPALANDCHDTGAGALLQGSLCMELLQTEPFKTVDSVWGSTQPFKSFDFVGGLFKLNLLNG